MYEVIINKQSLTLFFVWYYQRNLRLACERGDINEARRLLGLGADVNSTNNVINLLGLLFCLTYCLYATAVDAKLLYYICSTWNVDIVDDVVLIELIVNRDELLFYAFSDYGAIVIVCSCCSIIWVHFCLNRFWACFDYSFDFENDLLFIGLVYLAYLVCQFVDLICSCYRMAICYHASIQYSVSDLLCYMLLGWMDVSHMGLLEWSHRHSQDVDIRIQCGY